MTDRPDVPDDNEDEDPRRQLWVRAGVAGGLIAVLLGGLAVFDHLSRPPQPEAVVVPTKPIAPAQVTPLPEPGRDAPPDVVRAAAPTEPEPQPPVEGSSTPPPLPTGDKGDRLVERNRKPVEETRPVLRPGSQSVVAAPAAEPARRWLSPCHQKKPAPPRATSATTLNTLSRLCDTRAGSSMRARLDTLLPLASVPVNWSNSRTRRSPSMPINLA